MTKWLGARNCDLCGIPFSCSDVPWFADCVIALGISQAGRRCTWAVVCDECHAAHALHKSFGTGIGQKYDSTTFEKLEG